MITEIAQIKRWLSRYHSIPLLDEDFDCHVRLASDPPDGEHIIPIGVSETPFHVAIRDGLIHIGDKA